MMDTQKRSWSARHTVALALTALLGATLLLGSAVGCKSLGLPENRLQSCQNNDDCKAVDPKKPICANLRCVECEYDGDCESGICSNSTCQKLFTPAGEGSPDGPPKNRDACLSRCDSKGEGQACVDKCHADFPDEPDKK